MKLVDILARDLKVWPEGVISAVQDSDGEIKFDNSPVLPTINSDRRVWIRQGDYGDCLSSSLGVASDYQLSIVVRAQWQAAVDALKSKNVVEWAGEGLPPVGTVCEYVRNRVRVTVEVFAVKPNSSGSASALFTYEDGAWSACAEPSWFRPIRTPEQIAAEEREQEVRAILEQMPVKVCTTTEIVGWMLEQGYRKQVQP